MAKDFSNYRTSTEPLFSPLTDEDFSNFQALLEKSCGIIVKSSQKYLIEHRLSVLLLEMGMTNFSELYQKSRYSKTILHQVIDRITTNETSWFRDLSCWRLLEFEILPKLIKRVNEGAMSIKIWSAASSTGQEVYSLLILIDELLKKEGLSALSKRFYVLGTDISSNVLQLAQEAKYDGFTMNRGLSDGRMEKYFYQEENFWYLSDSIKEKANFRQLNLKEDFQHLGSFDLILCRNVAIYFSGTFKKDLLHRLGQVIRPNGSMLLGATETILGMETNFKTVKHQFGQYYQLKESE